MGLKNSILDSNVKSATNRDDGTKPSDAINFTGIKKIAAGGTTSSHTSQLSSVTSFSTIETPSNINKTDLNLMVPTPSGNPSLATIISTFQGSRLRLTLHRCP